MEIERNGIVIYEKFKNFSNCLKVLKKDDFEQGFGNTSSLSERFLCW